MLDAGLFERLVSVPSFVMLLLLLQKQQISKTSDPSSWIAIEHLMTQNHVPPALKRVLFTNIAEDVF